MARVGTTGGGEGERARGSDVFVFEVLLDPVGDFVGGVGGEEDVAALFGVVLDQVFVFVGGGVGVDRQPVVDVEPAGAAAGSVGEGTGICDLRFSICDLEGGRWAKGSMAYSK